MSVSALAPTAPVAAPQPAPRPATSKANDGDADDRAAAPPAKAAPAQGTGIVVDKTA